MLLIAAIGGTVAWLQWGAPGSPRAWLAASVTKPMPPAPAPPAVAAVELAPAPASAEPAASTPGPEAPPAPPPSTPATAPLPPPQQAALPRPQAPPQKPPPPPKPVPLTPAPDSNLIEKSDTGPLPVIALDGRKPWQVYARPFDPSDRRPRVAVLIVGLGLSGAANEAAINDLAGAVTLVFNPYATRLDDWIARARAAGHEVLLSLPMEPTDYPRVDPGPETLLTSLDSKQNLDRLRWVLTRVTGYVGVVSSAGSRFTTSKGDLLPILDEIKTRGLMFVDSRTTDQSVAASLAKSIGLPRSMSDVVLDQNASRDAIDQRLQQLETLARQNGVAVGITTDVYPVTLERIATWIPTLDKKGIALAPVSATADRQPDRVAQP